MSQHTQTSGATDPTGGAVDAAIAAKIPGADLIYDALMGPIEEDLTHAALPTLSKKYVSESPEDRAVRMERYRKAFAKYDKEYEKWIKSVNEELREKRNTAYHTAEAKVHREDEEHMHALEAQFSQKKEEAAEVPSEATEQPQVAPEQEAPTQPTEQTSTQAA